MEHRNRAISEPDAIPSGSLDPNPVCQVLARVLHAHFGLLERGSLDTRLDCPKCLKGFIDPLCSGCNYIRPIEEEYANKLRYLRLVTQIVVCF